MQKNSSRSDSKVAIIGGSGAAEFGFALVDNLKIKTPFSKDSVVVRINSFKNKKFVFLSRHGMDNKISPHKINYKANIWALKKIGVKNIFSFNSTGSLKNSIKPGIFLIPSDFIDFNPPTFYDFNPKFITPAFSTPLRKILIKSVKNLKIKSIYSGVYFNTKGPRLETKAEINMIKKFGDVVGMTMAKEATLAMEEGINYAAICSVDNYANGVSSKSISAEEIISCQKKNKEKIRKIIEKIINEGKFTY